MIRKPTAKKERREMHHRFSWFGPIDDRFLYKLHQKLPSPELDPKDTLPTYSMVVSSPGGWIYQGLCACEYILHLPGGVEVLATGQCMSAALMILACGNVGSRRATRFTRFMTHGASLTYAEDETTSTLRIEAGELEYLEDAYISMLAERTRKNAAWWAKRIKGKKEQWFFSAEEAKKYGLVDEVV